MEKISLVVAPREQKGTGKCRQLRKADIIPAVIYGCSSVKNVQVARGDFRKMMLEKGERAALIELQCGSEKILSLLQAFQRNALTDAFLHVDFKAVDPKETMVAKVPLKFVGDPVGVKDEGGILDIARRTVNLACLPKDLPEWLEVNITDLHLGQVLHVSDLPTISGIRYVTAANEVVAACTTSEEEEAAASTEAAPADATAAPAPGSDNAATKSS
jgi:large subunit ribosomal protein L25